MRSDWRWPSQERANYDLLLRGWVKEPADAVGDGSLADEISLGKAFLEFTFEEGVHVLRIAFVLPGNRVHRDPTRAAHVSKRLSDPWQHACNGVHDPTRAAHVRK